MHRGQNMEGSRYQNAKLILFPISDGETEYSNLIQFIVLIKFQKHEPCWWLRRIFPVTIALLRSVLKYRKEKQRPQVSRTVHSLL